MADFKEQKICIKFCFNLGKTVSETYEMLKNTLCYDPISQHKPLNGIHGSKMAKLWLRILNIQIAHQEVGLMKRGKSAIRSSMKTDSVQLAMFVTLRASQMAHAGTC
jgi:hypothetical protein